MTHKSHRHSSDASKLAMACTLLIALLVSGKMMVTGATTNPSLTVTPISLVGAPEIPHSSLSRVLIEAIVEAAFLLGILKIAQPAGFQARALTVVLVGGVYAFAAAAHSAGGAPEFLLRLLPYILAAPCLAWCFRPGNGFARLGTW